MSTGIIITDCASTPQPYLCFCCGKETKPNCPRFVFDRDTLEILDPRPGIPETSSRAYPIGSECRKFHPGIERYAVDENYKVIACHKCGKIKMLHAYAGDKWCGTCISREERRINSKEMWGRGRRGY